MKAYANFQKWALWIGLAGCAVAAILLLVTTKAHFITSFNREMLPYTAPRTRTGHHQERRRRSCRPPCSPAV